MLLSTVAFLALIGAATAAPAPQSSPNPPVSYDGRQLRFNLQLGKCLTARKVEVGSELGVDVCTEGPGQLFDTGPPHTVGVIRVKGTNLCVDAGDYSCKGNGSKLTLQNCGQGAHGAQEWWQSTDGRIELAGPVTHAHQMPPRSGQCMDLRDGNEATGYVQTWQCYDNNKNQRWDLGPWCRFC